MGHMGERRITVDGVRYMRATPDDVFEISNAVAMSARKVLMGCLRCRGPLPLEKTDMGKAAKDLVCAMRDSGLVDFRDERAVENVVFAIEDELGETMDRGVIVGYRRAEDAVRGAFAESRKMADVVSDEMFNWSDR